MKKRRIIIGLTVVIVIALAFTIFMTKFASDKFSNKIYSHYGEATFKLSDYGLTGEPVQLTTSDNLKLEATYIPVKSSKATVILVHGSADDAGENFMFPYAKYLYDAGYSTFTLSMRNYADSEGNKTTFGVEEWKDLKAAYDYVKGRVDANQKIGFVGLSFGASTILIAMGKADIGDFAVASVPYTTFASGVAYRGQIETGLPAWFTTPFIDLAVRSHFGWNYQDLQPISQVQNIDDPVLLIAAGKDERVNPQDAVELRKLGGENFDLWYEGDSPHDFFRFDADKCMEITIDFIEASI